MRVCVVGGGPEDPVQLCLNGMMSTALGRGGTVLPPLLLLEELPQLSTCWDSQHPGKGGRTHHPSLGLLSPEPSLSQLGLLPGA